MHSNQQSEAILWSAEAYVLQIVYEHLVCIEKIVAFLVSGVRIVLNSQLVRRRPPNVIIEVSEGQYMFGILFKKPTYELYYYCKP